MIYLAMVLVLTTLSVVFGHEFATESLNRYSYISHQRTYGVIMGTYGVRKNNWLRYFKKSVIVIDLISIAILFI